VIASIFVEKSELYDTTHQLTLKAARDRAARGNGTTVHSASHLAERHKTTPASGRENVSRCWQR